MPYPTNTNNLSNTQGSFQTDLPNETTGESSPLHESPEIGNQPANKRIRIESPTIQDIKKIASEVHTCLFSFHIEWVNKVTKELGIIDEPLEPVTPESLAQTNADSMKTLAEYKSRLIQQINAAPRADSKLVNLLRGKLIAAINSA